MNSIKLDCIMDSLYEMGYEDSSVFVNPGYENAIVGVSDDGHVVYRYEAIIEDLMKNDGMTYVEAVEFFDTNIARAIPYMEGVKPIIMYDINY